MASGGANVALYAGFWDEMERTKTGLNFVRSVASYSGSSAGAVVGTPLALRVPASKILRDVKSGGLQGKFPLLRAIAVYFGWQKAMYDGDAYVRRLSELCKDTAGQPMRPMTVAVTDTAMKQRCLTYTARGGLFNATVASASIPYVLNARHVLPVGTCVDGSVNRSPFANDVVIKHLRSNSSRHVVLLNCMPWPPFFRPERNAAQNIGIRALTMQWTDQLYAHGMESIINTFKPPLRFKDGIFHVQATRSGKHLVPDPQGRVKVTFLAPTSEEFARAGGIESAAHLSWSSRDATIDTLVNAGRQMARNFLRACKR